MKLSNPLTKPYPNQLQKNDASSFDDPQKKTKGYNSKDFMSLFLNQLKHQTPDSVADSNQVMNQLALFNQVELQVECNEILKKILTEIQQNYNSIYFDNDKKSPIINNNLNMVV